MPCRCCYFRCRFFFRLRCLRDAAIADMPYSMPLPYVAVSAAAIVATERYAIAIR